MQTQERIIDQQWPTEQSPFKLCVSYHTWAPGFLTHCWEKTDVALCCVKCTKIICSFLTNDLYRVFSKGSLEIFHLHMHVHTLTVAVLGAGVWPCCLPAGVPDLGVAPRCDYPGAPWLSQPGPPAPDTAPPSSGKDRRGGIRGWMRQGTQQKRFEETHWISNIRQRSLIMQYLAGSFVIEI